MHKTGTRDCYCRELGTPCEVRLAAERADDTDYEHAETMADLGIVSGYEGNDDYEGPEPDGVCACCGLPTWRAEIRANTENGWGRCCDTCAEGTVAV